MPFLAATFTAMLKELQATKLSGPFGLFGAEAARLSLGASAITNLSLTHGGNEAMSFLFYFFVKGWGGEGMQRTLADVER